MVGDVATPVDPQQFGPDSGRVDQHVLRLGPDTGGVHVGVLEQQQPVVSRRARRPQGPLERVRVPVGDVPAQPAQAQRPAGASI